MAYNNFTTEEVFLDESINILCNRIHEELINSFDGGHINDHFCITGTVAKIIQGAGAEDIVVVAFITDEDDIFDYVGGKLQVLLNPPGAIKFTDRIQMLFENVYVEIWHTVAMGTINTVSNLRVQDTADIPAYIN